MGPTATETISEPKVVVTADPEFPPHLMTIERYERLVETGVYGADDPVFLWKGRLVEKMSKGRPHCYTTMVLFGILQRIMPENWHVEFEAALRLGRDSMPEPDLMVVRGGLRDYLKHAPTARDVAIVIEVADSSIAQDSVTKLKSYAADGVPVYWIVNLPKQRIVVHSRPSGPVETPLYLEHHEYGPGDEIPVVVDGREVGRIVTREILP